MLLYFLYKAVQLKNIVYFLFREGILILVCDIFCLEINQTQIYSNKTNFDALSFLYGRSVKNIAHFYLLSDFEIGMHYLSEFDMYCNSN